MSIVFTLNGKRQALDVEPEMPLLWAIRDIVGLTGTKFGCGIAQCGSCTVHVDGTPVRSCSTPIGEVAGKKVTTIEAIGDTPIGKALQAAWIEHQVPQCGYCQSGQLMSAAALLAALKKPNDNQIDDALGGNLCRCGTYNRIRAAVKTASGKLG